MTDELDDILKEMGEVDGDELVVPSLEVDLTSGMNQAMNILGALTGGDDLSAQRLSAVFGAVGGLLGNLQTSLAKPENQQLMETMAAKQQQLQQQLLSDVPTNANPFEQIMGVMNKLSTSHEAATELLKIQTELDEVGKQLAMGLVGEDQFLEFAKSVSAEPHPEEE